MVDQTGGPLAGATHDAFVLVADRSHLRIFREERLPGQQTPGLRLVSAVDFPEGRAAVTERDSDQAGRFPGGTAAGGGMSTDERLSVAREQDRRIADLIAERMRRFLEMHAFAAWSWASGPDLHQAVLNRLPPGMRNRLRRALQKDLSNVPERELVEQFFE